MKIWTSLALFACELCVLKTLTSFSWPLASNWHALGHLHVKKNLWIKNSDPLNEQISIACLFVSLIMTSGHKYWRHTLWLING
jgi:hypothetical protein